MSVRKNARHQKSDYTIICDYDLQHGLAFLPTPENVAIYLGDIAMAKKHNYSVGHARQELNFFQQQCLRALDLYVSEQAEHARPSAQ